MLSSQTLQSLVSLNIVQIDLHNISYQSYKDILKDFRECGKSKGKPCDNNAYVRYVKAKDKELRKLHLLERNQRILLAELNKTYYNENVHMMTFVYDGSDWNE